MLKVKEVPREKIPDDYYILNFNYYYRCKYKDLKFYVGTMMKNNPKDFDIIKQFAESFVSEYKMVKDLINNNIYETAEEIQNYYYNEFGTFITFSNSLKIAKIYTNKKETIEELSLLFE
jgi:hypothetical protein